METHTIFLTLGGILLVGLVADEIGRKTRFPRVTLLIILGFIIGQSGLDLLPRNFQNWYEFIATGALTMVAFLLGGKLSLSTLRVHGLKILVISLMVVVVTTFLVGFGLILVGTPLIIAVLLAGISTATAPAATQDVVLQNHAKGPFTDTLLGVVAIDDVWGLIIFSFILVLAKALIGDGNITIFINGLWEIGGAILVGTIVGLPAAFLTGRLQEGEPVQTEALGLVFICAGLATWLEVSFLLAGIVAGVLVVNLATHHNRPFHEIEHIEWPFMILFFVLAGASLHLASLHTIGLVGAAYILLRLISRIIGGWLGATMAGADASHRKWIGLALVPQAGVALGMALIAGDQFPDYKETLLALVVSTTVVFELAGPVLTQYALHKVGEAK